MTRTVRKALSTIVLLCGIVTMLAARQPEIRPQARPAPPVVSDPDQEVEPIDIPEDDDLQQLIAQAEALAGADSPAGEEAIELIGEELEALEAALALKASLLDAGKDTAEADLEIATRSESLRAAIDATTEPEPEPDTSSEPAPIANTMSTDRDKLVTQIGRYAGEALSLLSKIQELLAIRRDDAGAAEPGDADPSEETLQDVAGVVTQSGEPVEGVSVTDPESGVTAVTDAEGQYTLEGVPAGRSAQLILSKSGTQVGEGQLNLPTGRDGVGDFDLKASGPGARTSVRVLPYVAVVRGAKAGTASKGSVAGVLRGADGRPVPRALVSLGTLARARTNSRGQYAFLNVPIGTHELKTHTPGFSVSTAHIRVTATRVDASMSLLPRSTPKSSAAKTLVRAGSGVELRGAVTSEAGPIRAAKVTLIRSGKAVSVRSGARGEFLLRHLDPGRYRVLVSKAGYRSAAELVSLERGASRVHRYELKRTAVRVSGAPRRTANPGTTAAVRTTSIATGRVVGRVVDAATRRPVRGASVAINGYEPVKTNAAGAYRILAVRPARHRVVVRTKGFGAAGRNVAVAAGKLARIDFALTRDRSSGPAAASPSTVPLVGRVLDARTRLPIAGAVVAAGGRRIATDSLGRFKVPDLRPGVHRIGISADGYQGATESVTLRANDRTIFTFVLTKAAAPSRRR